MPDINGLHLSDRLRGLQPDATFLLVSGQIDLNLAMEAVNAHEFAFVIQKPWERTELNSMLHRALAKHAEQVAKRQVQDAMLNATETWLRKMTGAKLS
jgi:FixJ family two-component response regulator